MHRFPVVVLLSTVVLDSAFVAGARRAVADERSSLVFTQRDDRLEISLNEKPLATYVFGSETILRPRLENVRAPDGTLVTRQHPPAPGSDDADHDTMHPGIWLSFGDLAGHDFWRNKATTEHAGFVEPPRVRDGVGSFAVRLRYRDGDAVLCESTCRYTIRPQADRVLIGVDAEFRGEREFHFGDQEEMGLGVRVNSAIRVRGGNGRIVNSDGKTNEGEVWGQPAQWGDYSGTIDGRRAGMLLMPHPQNFRSSWFHARDYGLLVANAFGRNAMTGGEKSKLAVRPGERFRLRYGVLVYSLAKETSLDRAAEFSRYVELAAE